MLKIKKVLLCSSVTWSLRDFLENSGKVDVEMANISHWLCNWETLQFSEESVSSVDPSLSTSILLLWWMFLLGEALLCTSFSAPTALPLLLLPGLTEIWAILDEGTQTKGQQGKNFWNVRICFPGWDSQFVQFLVHFWVNEQLCLTR